MNPDKGRNQQHFAQTHRDVNRKSYFVYFFLRKLIAADI